MRTHGHRKGSTKHWGLLGGKGEGQRWGELGRDSLGKNDIFKNIFLMFLSKNLKMKSIESIQNSLYNPLGIYPVMGLLGQIVFLFLDP